MFPTRKKSCVNYVSKAVSRAYVALQICSNHVTYTSPRIFLSRKHFIIVSRKLKKSEENPGPVTPQECHERFFSFKFVSHGNYNYCASTMIVAIFCEKRIYSKNANDLEQYSNVANLNKITHMRKLHIFEFASVFDIIWFVPSVVYRIRSRE